MVGTINPKVTHVRNSFNGLRNSFCFFVKFYTIHLWVVRNSYCFSCNCETNLWVTLLFIFFIQTQSIYWLRISFCFSSSCTQSMYCLRISFYFSSSCTQSIFCLRISFCFSSSCTQSNYNWLRISFLFFMQFIQINMWDTYYETFMSERCASN